MAPVPDFTGYATRNGLKCADGRIIMAGAFKGNDGQKVPLVWQHGHNDSDNVLGHAILKNVEDGVRADCYFNSNQKAQNAKVAVQHGDITSLSIHANQLVQKGMNVLHGVIREVSLVLSGANPGAYIDNVMMQHGDNEIQLDDEAIIYTGLDFELMYHASGSNSQSSAKKDSEPANASKPTADDPDPDGDGDNDLFDPADGGLDPNTASVADVLNTLTDEQKEVVYALIGAASQSSSTAAQSGIENPGGTVPTLAHSGTIGDKTVAEVIGSMTEEQKQAVHAIVNTAMEHSGVAAGPVTTITEGDPVPRNVFEQNANTPDAEGYTLSHADVKGIVQAAIKCGSLKEACEDFALSHGIDNIDVMFPPEQLINNQPEFISRRTEWVAGVLGGTRKSPFSRVKTILADITQDEARAKGYITGQMKKEEFFGVTRRTTTPTTVYKKQKLDRDDILDITDFDIVAWLKGEMRLMLDEEVARAILVGDGRDISDLDKVKDPAGAADGAGVRSILNDHEIYVTTLNVPIAGGTIVSSGAGANADSIVDEVVNSMRFFRGTGVPTFYTTLPVLTKLLLAKDTLGRRLYPTKADLASAMMVSDIIPCEALESSTYVDVLGIIVNMADYNIGMDNGGDISMFDFFDIDFNQQKYLIETRLSGALVKFKSALVVKMVTDGSTLVVPNAPTFDATTNVVTVPTQTGVTYINADTGATLSAGAQAALTTGTVLNVEATPNSTYYFDNNYATMWSFAATD